MVAALIFRSLEVSDNYDSLFVSTPKEQTDHMPFNTCLLPLCRYVSCVLCPLKPQAIPDMPPRALYSEGTLFVKWKKWDLLVLNQSYFLFSFTEWISPHTHTQLNPGISGTRASLTNVAFKRLKLKSSNLGGRGEMFISSFSGQTNTSLWKGKKKKDRTLANTLQNKIIIITLNENISLRMKFSFLACADRQMYFCICLGRFGLKMNKWNLPGTICQKICSLPLSVVWTLEWLKTTYFVSGFTEKGEIFSKIAHKMAGLPETGFGGRQRHHVGILGRVSGSGGSVAWKASICSCHLHILG